MSVCWFVCLFSKRVSGSSYIVKNASNAAVEPCSPEMKPALAAVGSAAVAFSHNHPDRAAIFCHESGSRGLQ